MGKAQANFSDPADPDRKMPFAEVLGRSLKAAAKIKNQGVNRAQAFNSEFGKGPMATTKAAVGMHRQIHPGGTQSGPGRINTRSGVSTVGDEHSGD